MDDKLQYISKIKEERNKAQDELAELRKILDEEIKPLIDIA